VGGWGLRKEYATDSMNKGKRETRGREVGAGEQDERTRVWFRRYTE